MATENLQTATQPAMEDILSSIRSGVEDEQANVGKGSADLIDAAAEQDGDEDILELSAADMVTPAAAANDEAEELIDIAAFASSGEAKPATQTAADMAADILGEMGMSEPVAAAEPEVAAAPAEGGAADEFDRLLAEISQEQQQNVAAAEVTKQALMDEEEPLGTEEVTAETEVAEDLTETVATAAVAELSGMAPAAGGASFALSSVQGPEGVQIAFPAEVLAMALRPMVQDWLSKNLPGVVEKLVKEEISKLTQN